jgi:hypothetical protein
MECAKPRLPAGTRCRFSTYRRVRKSGTGSDYGRGIGWVWERLFGESGTYGTILAIQREALQALGRQ